MDENKKNEIFQNQENGQINGSEKPKEPSDNINIPQSPIPNPLYSIL